MDKVRPNSKPETLDTPSAFGGRRPSSCSTEDGFVGLLFMPLFYAALAVAFISVILDAWSLPCFISGMMIAICVRDAVEKALQQDESNATLSHEEGGKEQL